MNIVTATITFIISSFFYFSFGFQLISELMSVLIPTSTLTAGTITYFFVSITPYVPILGLMWLGYTIFQDVSGGNINE